MSKEVATISPQELVRKTENLITQIKQLKASTLENYLKLGALFKVIRDEKLYELKDHGSFESFIADPEVGLGRSTVYMCIHFWELFILECRLKPVEICGIPINHLQIIAPLVKELPEKVGEFVSIAATNSKKDLIDWVREYRKLPPKEYKDAKQREHDEELQRFRDYEAYVRAYGCCICEDREPDAHHFPRTFGASRSDFKFIPLCRRCHLLAQRDHIDFLIANQEKIFDYFYNTFEKAFNVIRTFSS